MPIYKLVSNDYPSGTFTSISVIPPQNARASANSLNVQLPLPHQLIYDSDFDWSSENMSIAMTKMVDLGIKSSTVVSSGIRDGQQIGDIASDVIKNSLSDATDTGKAVGIQQLKRMITKADGPSTNITGASAEDTAKYIMKGLGVVYNPNKQLFFNGIPHREFTLSFDIVAQNADQAKQAAQAIKAIRVASTPEYTDGQFFFKYPSNFSAQIQVLGHTIIERPSFVIKRIATNLAPNGIMSWHSDGKPVAYSLEISCMESMVTDKKSESERKYLGE